MILFVEISKNDKNPNKINLKYLFACFVFQVNFIICQISALFLASLFRSVLHPSKVNSTVRHIVALIIGLVFGYFCFGPQAIHIAGLPAACYVVIRTQSPKVVQRYVKEMKHFLQVMRVRLLYSL